MILRRILFVIALLASVGSINTSGASGSESELLYAAERGDSTLVATFLQSDANVNAQDNHGRTALMYAALNGHTSVSKMLLNAGADTDTEAKNGSNALLSSVWQGHVDVVKCLTEAGTNVNAGTSDDLTPLTVASSLGHTEIVDLLLEKGAEANPGGPSALGAAAEKGYWDIVKILLLNWADINVEGKRGMTVLHKVTVSDDTLGARVLLECGVDERTALLLATVLNDTNTVKALLDLGIAFDAKDETNRAALLMAGNRGRLGLLELLLRDGGIQDNTMTAVLQKL